MLNNMDPNDLAKLMRSIKDMSDSMLRIEAERSAQKEITNDICETLDLDKKVFRKLARTYHKQNFDEEVEVHHQFEKIYQNVVKSNP